MYKIITAIVIMLLIAWNLILTIDAVEQDEYNKTNNETHQQTLEVNQSQNDVLRTLTNILEEHQDILRGHTVALNAILDNGLRSD